MFTSIIGTIIGRKLPINPVTVTLFSESEPKSPSLPGSWRNLTMPQVIGLKVTLVDSQAGAIRNLYGEGIFFLKDVRDRSAIMVCNVEFGTNILPAHSPFDIKVKQQLQSGKHASLYVIE